MFVDPKDLDAFEARRVGVHRLQQRSDRTPHRPPRRPQLPGQPQDRGVLASHLLRRPPARPGRQQPARTRHLTVLFGEHRHRARLIGAGPGPFPPHQLHRPPEARCVDQLDLPPAMAQGHDPARRAPHQPRRRLDLHPQTLLGYQHLEDVQPVQADQEVAVAAVHGRGRAACSAARRRLGHRRGPHGNGSWSFRILRASTQLSAHQHARRVTTAPTSSPKSHVGLLEREHPGWAVHPGTAGRQARGHARPRPRLRIPPST